MSTNRRKIISNEFIGNPSNLGPFLNRVIHTLYRVIPTRIYDRIRRYALRRRTNIKVIPTFSTRKKTQSFRIKIRLRIIYKYKDPR